MNPNQNNLNGGQVNPGVQGTQQPVTQPQSVPTPQPINQPQVSQQQPVMTTQPVQPQQVVNNIPGPQSVSGIPTAMPEQQVINNEERKKSNPIVVIILIALLILFIYKMDVVEEYFNKYILKKSPEVETTQTSTETNELIKIGETTTYNKVSNIKFYNFKKGDETNLIFTYEASEKINTPELLGIVIELYDANKKLINKEKFITKEAIEKDTAKTYNISLKSDVYDYYNNSYYILVKKYTDDEINSTSSFTCKKTTSLDTSILDEEIKYNFKNNELISYDVNKSVKIPEGANVVPDKNVTTLSREYNNIYKFIKSVNYSNNTLKYTVDLGYSIEGFEPLYEKGTIVNIIKSKEEDKEWKCE